MNESNTPLSAEEGDDDHWLASYTVHCEKCRAELLMLEHSPFENGYYLYCDTCPRRVDVSVYDSVFQGIEAQVKARHSPEEMDSRYLELLMPEIEARLRPCACAGHFRHHTALRCLHCSAVLPGAPEGFNLWFPDDEANFERYDAMLNALIQSEDIWRKA